MPDEAGERAARARAEERAWREIVDHYGEPALPDAALDPGQPVPEPAEVRPPPPELDDEAFTPPPLPPPPVVSPERRVAWVGLVVSPVLLVLVNLVHYALPGILTGALVVAFIASFGYLVATMAPRDPDDDGARV
jgi:hypothetical protein